MAPEPVEQWNVSLVSHHDLDGRPGFKLALQEVGGRWFLYTASLWHSGWSILDVTDPSEPELLNYVEGPSDTATIQIQVADGLMITSLERPIPGWMPGVDDPENFEEGAYVWDVATDPADPQFFGHYETGGAGTHRNYYAGGDYAYMAAVPDDCESRMLEVVDLADPTEPEVVGRWWWPGQHADDEKDTDESYHFHGPAYVQDDRAYLSYGRVGVVVLDVSDPTDPQFLTRLDMGDFGSWLGVHSAIPLPGTDLLAINDEAILEGSPLSGDGGDPMNYTVLADVSDLRRVGFDGQSATGPRIVGWIPEPRPETGCPYETYHDKPGRFGPHNQHHYDEGDASVRYRSADHLVMTWFNAGLRIFDVSNPLAPREAGYYVPEDPETRIGTKPEGDLVTQFEDVLVDSRGNIYCTDKNHGLFVLESDVL